MSVEKIQDAREIVAELLKEIYEDADLTPRERSIVTQLETLKGILAEADADEDDDEDSVEDDVRWVFTDSGEVLVQHKADNKWGFSLSDGENSWAGGFDILRGNGGWRVIENDNPRITEEHRKAMGWLFSERHDDGSEPRKAWYDRGIGSS